MEEPPDPLKVCGFPILGGGLFVFPPSVSSSPRRAGELAEEPLPGQGGSARPWLSWPCQRRPAEGALTLARASPFRSVPQAGAAEGAPTLGPPCVLEPPDV